MSKPDTCSTQDLCYHSNHNLITSWDAPPPNPDLANDQILSLYYFADSLTACLVLAGGDIVVVREEPQPGEDRIEIVGSVDAGIAAARWSPDEELLAIATKADTLVFMSRSFEGILDVAMTSEDLKASNHVSVGWGKKETQFKGRGAKAMRDPTMPEKTDEGVLSSDDGGEVTVSWRGDGAFLAVSSIEDSQRRLIRVYSREGVLDSVSEPVDGLEGALSWRPLGNLMAGIQRLSDRVDVVFFERNGLRHGQFTLRSSSEELSGKHIKLAWNHDSTVLAVTIGFKVQLWTMGNYHWYLKQELDFSAEGLTTVAPVVWHPEQPLLFSVAQHDAVVTVEHAFGVASCSAVPPFDFGAVAVIDGKILKLTPLRSANVPPPMSHYELSVEESIIDVAFNHRCSSLAVLHQKGIAVYDWNTTAKSTDEPRLTGRATFSKDGNIPAVYRQICFGEEDRLQVLKYEDGSEPIISSYGFDQDTGRMQQAANIEPEMVPVFVSSYDLDGQKVPYIQDASGNLRRLLPTGPQLLNSKFPAALPYVDIAVVGEEHVAFGLSRTGTLYANSRVLVKNCTSFVLTPAHLIFTTTTHLIKFVHITSESELEVPPDDPEKDERCRSIERGARLVTAMPSASSVVLQMPRGNLETIYPRAMVLARIRKLIDEKNYKGAFLTCRTQRVDMNLLYDHAPDQFMTNVALLIDQIKKVTYIDLFLSSLRDENVTESLYKDTRRLPRGSASAVNANSHVTTDPNAVTSGKTNRVCDAMLQVLKSRTGTNLQNIITANVSKSPPALDDGLRVVAGLMATDEALADKAVEHICFLADANKLYDNALGLYNLDLALLVAQQSQKDPREYLPFLQKLQEMPLLRRQFSIDDYLGRHAKALTHLHEISQDSSEELEIYVVKHKLYQPALTLYRYNTARHASIMALYAAYLESTSQLHAAALAYESLQLYGPAASCYQRAGSTYFRECLYCFAQQSPVPTAEATRSLASTLADSLYEAKDYLSCASLYSTYLDNIPSAVSTLCKGYHFSNALLLCIHHNRNDLLAPNGVLDTGLSEALSSSLELLAECKSQLKAQVPRIIELREKALADPLAFYEGEINEDLPDDISVAASSRVSTSASLFTRYTGRQSAGTAATGVSRMTSKNRRREERKRARGKKGSVYEEEYLVASVGRLVERIERTREEVQRLVEALVRRGMREQARSVEALLAEVIDMCKAAIPQVYGEQEQQPLINDDGEEDGYRPIGADAVFAESLQEAAKKKVAPVIGAFEKLTLLGS